MRQDEVICKSLQRSMSQDSTPELTAAEKDHLAFCDDCSELLLISLLQQRPDVEMPADFPDRVRFRLDHEPSRSKLRGRTPVYAFTTAIALLLLLVLACGAFTYADPTWTAKGGVPLALEYIVTFEIAAIALWLGIRRSAH